MELENREIAADDEEGGTGGVQGVDIDEEWKQKKSSINKSIDCSAVTANHIILFSITAVLHPSDWVSWGGVK